MKKKINSKIVQYDMSVKRSFATKVCFWVLITTLIVFVLCFGSGLWFASEGMLEEGHCKANLELDKAILFVDNEMTAVETAGNNFASQFDKDRRQEPEEVYAQCRSFLKANPGIQGIVVAFEHGVYPEYEQGFSPYVMVKDGKAPFQCNLGDRYDYTERDWYKETLRGDSARWTNPYQEVNGTIVTIYCFPIVNSKGERIGVMGFDLSLDRLTERLQDIRPYPNSFITMMDRNLNFIAHPDKELIMKGNPAQVLDKKRYEVNETIFIDIKNFKRGIGAFGEAGEEKYLYYAPVKKAGWTITLECAESEITADMKAIRLQMLIISVVGIIGLLLVTFLIMRRLLRPISQYSDAAMSIAEGNFHTPMPEMRDHNELWKLGRSLNYMQRSLDEKIHDLAETTKEKSKIESELNIASRIQMSMIPKIFPPYPDRDDIDIFGSLIPAKAVGGDLYDFFLRDEKLFFCVGDVSGKGVPASLVMVVTRSLVRIVAAQESRPDKIVAALNNLMSDMNDSNMFVTLFIGVLDMPTGRFRYCNAGHNAPVILNPETNEVSMLPVKPNLPVAILPEMKFEMEETVIRPGMSIFLYTDGLTEAENADKQLFGEDRMMSVLKEQVGNTARVQVESMLEQVHEHADGAEQSDDLTLVSIKYNRKKRETTFYRRLTLHNDVKETPRIAEFMDDVVGETGIDPMLASGLNLALEEAVVNVMNYAYPKGEVGHIYLEVFANDVRLKFVITDNGVPFDPTTASEPDVTADLEDRPIGGLGIFLVRQLMDSVNYERVNGENVLTLRKMLKADGKIV